MKITKLPSYNNFILRVKNATLMKDVTAEMIKGFLWSQKCKAYLKIKRK